jgi:hypothetical protein
LVEIAFLAIACYIACFVTLPLMIGAISLLEKATNRETTDPAGGFVLAVGVVGGGLIVRYGLFDPNVSHDLDAFGTGFAALIGLVVLASPFVLLWYRAGSKPRQ